MRVGILIKLSAFISFSKNNCKDIVKCVIFDLHLQKK